MAVQTAAGTVVRVVARAAVAAGAICAAGAVALVVRGPAGWYEALLAGTAVVFLPVGLVGAAVVGRNPRHRVGWIFLVAGLCLPLSMVLTVAGDAGLRYHDASVPGPVWLVLLSGPPSVLAVPLVGTFGVLLFPDGRVGGRRRRALAVACAVDLALLLVWALFMPELLDPTPVPNPIGAPGALGGAVDGLVLAILVMGPLTGLTSWALLRRARRSATPQPIRLAALAGFVVSAAYLACLAVGMSGGATAPVAVLENCAALAVGVAAWVGVVRYGLFDLRAVLNRALVYGSLTAVVVGVYLAASVLLGRFFAGAVPAVLAAAAGALAVLPLRDVVQRRINHLLYGLRDEPAVAFARLGERLDAAAAPDDVLPAVARTVAEALRARYVAIEVAGERLAEAGRPGGGPVDEVPLPFAGETVGRLVLEARDPAAPVGAAGRALLDTLASQVAVAARAVALTHALRQSREWLVSAREEERRRLRRELHDGLGPTLAGIALGIDTARRALPRDASTADLLGSLREEAERAVADIRRIAYDLRPPILDELGLAGAVREQAARLGGATVEVPEELPALPAAVEVAAYRIAVEALTNAARHAPGTPVLVRLAVNGRLELSVSDGGTGVPTGFRAGVGITSMRERAAELGGQCVIATGDPGGTVVRAHLPLAPPQAVPS